MDITLGLDFGTHQTKLCLSYMPNNDTIHEFIEFKNLEGAVTTMLPSVIQINQDDTISIGFVDINRCKGVVAPIPSKPEYPAEPMAVLPTEPKKFYPPKPKEVALDWKDKLLALTKGIDKNKFAHEKWKKECAAIDREYDLKRLAWKTECVAIKSAHDQWLKQVSIIDAKHEALLSNWKQTNSQRLYYRYFKLSSFSASYPWPKENLIDADTLSIWYLTYLMLYVKRVVKEKFGEAFEESVAIQMGVPSGVNMLLSGQIKTQAFRLLISARKLMEHFDSPESLCQIKYTDLLAITNIPTNNIAAVAELYGFFVMPEAYAGLQSLTNRQRLSRGKMHILVDIGGGTTDIAFFTINENLAPDVHTVFSFHKGLNYVFDIFCEDNKAYSLSEAQELFSKDRVSFSRGLSLYRKELSLELDKLIEYVKHQFMIHTSSARLRVEAITEAMQGCPIVYCGGGSVYAEMRVRTRFFTDMRLVDKTTLSIPNLKNRSISDEHYTILATSYGLSVPQFEEPVMKDLSLLFKIIENNVMDGRTTTPDRFEYGIIDD